MMRKTIKLDLETEVDGPNETIIDTFGQLIQGDLSQAVLQQMWDDTCPQGKVWAENKEYAGLMNISLVQGHIRA